MERIASGPETAPCPGTTRLHRQSLQRFERACPAFEIAVADLGTRFTATSPPANKVPVVRSNTRGRQVCLPSPVQQLEHPAAGPYRRVFPHLPLGQHQPGASSSSRESGAGIQAMCAARFHQRGGFAVRENGNAAIFECGIAEQKFLHRVRDHHQLDRLGRHPADCRQHAPAVTVRDAGVDDHHAGGADDEAAVAHVAAICRRDLAGVGNECVYAVATSSGRRSSVARAGQAASGASASAWSAILASRAAMARSEIMCREELSKALTVIETAARARAKGFCSNGRVCR